MQESEKVKQISLLQFDNTIFKVMFRQIVTRQAVAAAKCSSTSVARLVFGRTFITAPKTAVRAGCVVQPRISGLARRHYSPITQDQAAKPYEYKDIKKLASQSEHAGIVLVDVREPDEYAAGHIPTAINIPFNSSPGALGLEPEEFQDAFGFAKPKPDEELVFYCLAGVRSTAAEQLAATFGYEK
jgi:rhodanese-related sulfurtransferase